MRINIEKLNTYTDKEIDNMKEEELRKKFKELQKIAKNGNEMLILLSKCEIKGVKKLGGRGNCKDIEYALNLRKQILDLPVGELHGIIHNGKLIGLSYDKVISIGEIRKLKEKVINATEKNPKPRDIDEDTLKAIRAAVLETIDQIIEIGERKLGV